MGRGTPASQSCSFLLVTGRGTPASQSHSFLLVTVRGTYSFRTSAFLLVTGGGVTHLVVLDLFWKQGGCLGPEEHNLCLPCAPSSPGVSVQCSLESLCSDSGESHASMLNAL